MWSPVASVVDACGATAVGAAAVGFAGSGAFSEGSAPDWHPATATQAAKRRALFMDARPLVPQRFAIV
jgi:hypothetical protein